jgi:CBS domain-containing protein
VATLIEEHLLASDQRSYPVLGDDGRLAGMVTLEDVRKVPPEARAGRTVAEIMTPARELATIAPGAPASDALRALAASPQQQLPVIADGRLQGLLRREDIVKWLTLKGAP